MENLFELFSTANNACVDDRLGLAISRVLRFHSREIAEGLAGRHASFAGLVDISVSPPIIHVRLSLRDKAPPKKHRDKPPEDSNAATRPAAAITARRQLAQRTDTNLTGSNDPRCEDLPVIDQQGSTGSDGTRGISLGSSAAERLHPEAAGLSHVLELYYEAYGKKLRASSLDKARIEVLFRRTYRVLPSPAPTDPALTVSGADGNGDAADVAAAPFSAGVAAAPCGADATTATATVTASGAADAAKGCAGLTDITSDREAALWLAQNAQLLPEAAAKRLQDWSPLPDPVVRLLAHLLLAITDWVLAPQSLSVGPGTGLNLSSGKPPAPADASAVGAAVTATAATSPGADADAPAMRAAIAPVKPAGFTQPMLVRLRPWAFAIHRNENVRLLGGCVRPALGHLAARNGSRAAGAGASALPAASLIELLNAPPLRFSVAREVLMHDTADDDDNVDLYDGINWSYSPGWTLQLQRLSAIMKQFHGRTDGPLLVAAKRVRSRLEPLLVGDPLYDKQAREQQQHQLRPQPKEEGAAVLASREAASDDPATGAGSSASAAGTPSVVERSASRQESGLDVAAFMRDLGATDEQLHEVLAMSEIDANVGFCVECGESGKLVACDTCVDSFCCPCLGVATYKLLPDPWSCRYCEMCTQRDSVVSGSAAPEGRPSGPVQEEAPRRRGRRPIQAQQRTSEILPQPASGRGRGRGSGGFSAGGFSRGRGRGRCRRRAAESFEPLGDGGGEGFLDRSERPLEAAGSGGPVASMTSDAAADALMMLHRQQPDQQRRQLHIARMNGQQLLPRPLPQPRLLAFPGREPPDPEPRWRPAAMRTVPTEEDRKVARQKRATWEKEHKEWRERQTLRQQRLQQQQQPSNSQMKQSPQQAAPPPAALPLEAAAAANGGTVSADAAAPGAGAALGLPVAGGEFQRGPAGAEGEAAAGDDVGTVHAAAAAAAVVGGPCLGGVPSGADGVGTTTRNSRHAGRTAAQAGQEAQVGSTATAAAATDQGDRDAARQQQQDADALMEPEGGGGGSGASGEEDCRALKRRRLGEGAAAAENEEKGVAGGQSLEGAGVEDMDLERSAEVGEGHRPEVAVGDGGEGVGQGAGAAVAVGVSEDVSGDPGRQQPSRPSSASVGSEDDDVCERIGASGLADQPLTAAQAASGPLGRGQRNAVSSGYGSGGPRMGGQVHPEAGDGGKQTSVGGVGVCGGASRPPMIPDGPTTAAAADTEADPSRIESCSTGTAAAAPASASCGRSGAGRPPHPQPPTQLLAPPTAGGPLPRAAPDPNTPAPTSTSSGLTGACLAPPPAAPAAAHGAGGRVPAPVPPFTATATGTTAAGNVASPALVAVTAAATGAAIPATGTPIATPTAAVGVADGVLTLSEATEMVFRVMEAAEQAGVDKDVLAGWLDTLDIALDRFSTDQVLQRMLSACLRALCGSGGRGPQVTQLALGSTSAMLRRTLGPRQPSTA